MFSASAQYYDQIYSQLKDYSQETDRIDALVRRVNPRAATILDVGCGTGEHARRLAARGFVVDGLDLDPAFVRIAQTKHQIGRFFEADMCRFALPSRYDAILCLFSSIGYVRTIDRVRDALGCFRDHLNSRGVILVEPWFPPGGLDPARVATNVSEAAGVRVVRVSHVEIEGRRSRLFFDYEVSDATGTRRMSERHDLGLFTTSEMIEAFRDVGLDVEHDPDGFTDRGLFIARATP